MIDIFLDPLVEFSFMRLGLAAAMTVGLTSAVLSCLLVVRHQALLGDAISHSVLLGVAIGYFFAQTAGIFWGALIVAVLSGMVMTYIERHTPVKLDAVMGIIFTGTFALGLAIISITEPRGIDLFHILFGNVLGVSGDDLTLTMASGAGVLGLVFVRFRSFHLWSFDPLMAEALGMRVGLLEYLLIGMLSATIVAALQAVGLILVIAMLITPGATALLLTSRLRSMMAVAGLLGVGSATGGLYLSFYVDMASGPAIVLMATAGFVVAFLLAPRRGIVARWFQRNRLTRRVLTEDLLKELYDSDDRSAATPIDKVDTWLNNRSASRRRLRRMERRGLVLTNSKGVRLSQEGHERAVQMVRTHRLLERYAHDADGIPITHLHDVAERLEHMVDPADLQDMNQLLGEPTVDPHGHPIPTSAGLLQKIAGRPLTDWPAGKVAKVVMVGDDRRDVLERMVALGILPDQAISVVRKDADGLIVRVSDNDLLHVSVELADRVYVVPMTTPVARST